MGMQKTIKLNVNTTEDLWPYQVVDEIQKVMEQGERDGKRDWDKKPMDYHVDRALAHINGYTTGKTNEDHLAHAFTRLMMAMAIERGYTDKEK